MTICLKKVAKVAPKIAKYVLLKERRLSKYLKTLSNICTILNHGSAVDRKRSKA